MGGGGRVCREGRSSSRGGWGAKQPRNDKVTRCHTLHHQPHHQPTPPHHSNPQKPIHKSLQCADHGASHRVVHACTGNMWASRQRRCLRLLASGKVPSHFTPHPGRLAAPKVPPNPSSSPPHPISEQGSSRQAVAISPEDTVRTQARAGKALPCTRLSQLRCGIGTGATHRRHPPPPPRAPIGRWCSMVHETHPSPSNTSTCIVPCAPHDTQRSHAAKSHHLPPVSA